MIGNKIKKNQNCLIDVWVNVRDIVCFFSLSTFQKCKKNWVRHGHLGGGCLKVKENEVFTPCTLDVQFVLTADVFQHKIHDVIFGGVVFSLRFFVINVFDWKQNQKKSKLFD